MSVPCFPSLLTATRSLARATRHTRPTNDYWTRALIPRCGSPCMRSLCCRCRPAFPTSLPFGMLAAMPARCRVLCCDAEDPWLLLGVSYSATDAQIRRAFRHQARELHPDVCTDPEAPEQFRSLVEAFKKLRTDESRARWRTQSRAAYDRRVRGSAKERAARAWGAPDRPRGSTSRPARLPSAAACRRQRAGSAELARGGERAQAQAQTATTPPSPPRSAPAPPPPPPPPPCSSSRQLVAPPVGRRAPA